MISNSQGTPIATDDRDLGHRFDDDGGPSEALPPRSAAALDPVETALAAGVQAIAASMGVAAPGDLVTLADRMATLARELEARRLARANVIPLASRRERSR